MITEFNLQIFAVQKPPQPPSYSFLPYMSVNRLQTHFPVLGATLQPAPLPSFSFQMCSSCQGWGAGLLSRKECKQTVCAPSPGRPVRESGDSSEVTHSPTATPQRCCDPATLTSLLTAVGEKLQEESSCPKCNQKIRRWKSRIRAYGKQEHDHTTSPRTKHLNLPAEIKAWPIWPWEGWS